MWCELCYFVVVCLRDKFTDIFTNRYERITCSKGARSKSTAAVDPQQMVHILTSTNTFLFRQRAAHGQIGSTDRTVIFWPPSPQLQRLNTGYLIIHFYLHVDTKGHNAAALLLVLLEILKSEAKSKSRQAAGKLLKHQISLPYFLHW